jgi:hypothetical protein
MERDDIRDSLLGSIPWHEHANCWGVTIAIQGRDIPLGIMAAEESGPPIDFVRSLVTDLRDHEERFRQYAARELLDDYNESWRRYSDDERPISARDFVERFSLQMVTVEHGLLCGFGNRGWIANLVYDASDMFTEHRVTVLVTGDAGTIGAAIE